MQQRVNRWLSPELLAAAQQTTTPAQPSFAQATAPAEPSSLSWQRLAALVLLLGSAAFSYVAWSDVGVGQATISRFYSSGNSSSDDESGTASPGDQTARVHQLREQNRQLHARLEALKQDLASLRSADPTP